MRIKMMLAVMIVGSAALLVSAGGCSSAPETDRVTVDSLSRDLTPEMEGVGLSHDQRRNRHIRTVNTSMRQIWDDLDEILLLNRPSRMSPYPIP